MKQGQRLTRTKCSGLTAAPIPHSPLCHLGGRRKERGDEGKMLFVCFKFSLFYFACDTTW